MTPAVEALLGPVSAGDPCGPSIEYDLAFKEVEILAAGRPEQQMGQAVVPAEPPDWAQVERRSIPLLARSKDLRLAVFYLRARTHRAGVVGLSEGVALLRGLLERYWDGVYPRIDDGDPSERLNAVAIINDVDALVGPLKLAEIVTVRGIGAVRVRDLLDDVASAARGPSQVPPSAQRVPPLDRILDSADRTRLDAVEAAAAQVVADLAETGRLIVERLGHGRAIDFAPVLNVVGIVARRLHGAGAAGGGGHEEGRAMNESAPQAVTSVTEAGQAGIGQVRSRGDVVRVLDELCRYYERTEPSSPIPILLRRAQRLVDRSFKEIIEDLIPEAVSQVEHYQGKPPQGGETSSKAE